MMETNMGRKSKELGALAVQRLTAPGLHFVGGVAGLALQVTPSGARSWVLRYMVAGRRRDMGLGGFPDVTLAIAREAARAARVKIAGGVDPIDDAHKAKSALIAARASDVTFRQCAEQYVSDKEAGWKSDKHRKQWLSTLETHAYPQMGKLIVRDVAVAHVVNALKPIWSTKTETASRVRGRIEQILDWAAARGYRSGANPARWKGHLDMVLPKPSAVATGEHYPALPLASVHDFAVKLRHTPGTGARALELLLLTATRSGDVRGATWSEFDLEAGVWTIPKERTKTKVTHRVPLSAEALKIIKARTRVDEIELVFPGTRGGKLSDMTLSQQMRRFAFKDDAGKVCVPHGLRSTFRDWCSEHTNYPREVAEMALAHVIESKVEAAYRRGDLFEKRRRLMQDWAKFCTTPKTVAAKNIVHLRARAQ
jgi:integrase